MKRSFVHYSALSLLLFAWRGTAAVLLVNPASDAPLAPFSTWTTAARSIQEAADAALDGDQILNSVIFHPPSFTALLMHWDCAD